MTAPTPPSPPPSTTKLIRKLIIELSDARNLLPKDGQGNSSPYVEIDFAGERKRSKTIHRDLNPAWHEQIEFLVMDLHNMDYSILEIEVFTDNNNNKKQFLGRVKIYGSQFTRFGEKGVVYFPLEKKSVFSSVRGHIGLRIGYLDEEISVDEAAGAVADDNNNKEADEIKRVDDQEKSQLEIPQPTETAQEAASCNVGDDSSFVPQQQIHEQMEEVVMNYSVPTETPLQEVRKMQTTGTTERVRYFQRPSTNHGMEYQPRVIPGRFSGEMEQNSTTNQEAYDLVEPMRYLFVRIVKGCNISVNDNPYVKIRCGNHFLKSRPALIRQQTDQQGGSEVLEWNQTFALSQNRQPLVNSPTLEVSISDGKTNQFLGGVCLDLSEVPVRRDARQTDFAPEWYNLEGGSNGDEQERITGKIQLAVWVGTQADSAFPLSYTSESPFIDYTKPKVYQSPRLWYLRVTIIETSHDLQVRSPPHSLPDIRVKAQLGFQFVRTRRGSTNNHHSSSFFWNEDLIFVSKDPNPTDPSSDEQLKFFVEDRLGKDTALLGEVSVPLSSIHPPRIDDRDIPSRWLSLRGGGGGSGDADNGGSYSGRIHVRLCFEGGYHVLDEAAHVCSDFQPTAKQLCKQPMGVLELGIRGARGLLPMKTRGGGKGSTDAYCVAKYGKKWCRTKTIVDSFDPRWNEQYKWEVYDPCTVLTIGVFDNWRMYGDMADKPDCRIGKIRIRVSTLESNKVYTSSYPLLVLLRSGLKKMGEIEIAIRFACPLFLPETCSVYGTPLLPKLHYLRPIGLGQQEALRSAATKMVAKHVANAEPPLNPEVVRYMLDADSHTWSMRKSKANWYRILSVLSWAIGFWKWVDDIRQWRNPLTTILVHFLYLVLVWYPEMIVPTGSLYLFLIGVWYYRFKPKIPAGMDIRLSQAERLDPDELEEELDTYPSSCPNEVIRMRYDRLRTLAGRVQKVLGDFAAQGERVQALLSWRDPRATRLFIGVLLIVAVILYVVPPKMVAVALGFYLLRHPMFRDPMPPASLNFFRRLPSLSDRLI
ncbi:hypothetical protein MKW92_006751 [Papaver armeniacum]|nr:hypothetical protein MKW92_006751 [Papaver armeniacum]